MPVPTSTAPMSFTEKSDRENSNEQEDMIGGRPLQQFAGQKESMILVQVNPGETFTIQAENETQCITGPAQVPMVSPNGAIPPIQVPHGYISQVIEDQHGLRKVVVIPETQPARFPGGPGSQPMVSQSGHGMSYIPMQSGANYSYLHQMSPIPMNQQLYSAGEHLHMFHSQPVYAPPPEGLGPDIEQHIAAIQQPYQYAAATMDPDAGRANKMRDRSQRNLQERRPDANKNSSPSSTHSISPSSSSSYATSPNSSPDSSPKIMSSPVTKYPDGYPQTQQMKTHPYQVPHPLTGHQEYLPTQLYQSTYNLPGSNSYGNQRNNMHSSSKTSVGDEISSGSSSAGSPRRIPSSRVHKTTSRDLSQQYHQDTCHQQRDSSVYFSNEPPFPTKDGKWELAEYLSAISKPEVYDISPRRAWVKCSMRYSLPPDFGTEIQSMVFEVFLMHKGKDGNKFKLHKRECSNCIEIKDLKPGAEYQAKILAEVNSVRGEHSEVTTFRTTSCPPDTPGAPKMIHCSKNSITLKWTPPNDNGEKITKYYLEWDEGEKGSGFRSLFSDNQKQHKVTKLQPSRDYTFRLSCENKVDVSPWSPEVTHRTSGTAPATPDPPSLNKAFVRSLAIVWSRSPSGSNDPSSGYHTRFTLERDDGNGYGYRAIYDGSDLRMHVKDLNKSSLYRFRLRAYNSEGRSGYSAPASFYTLPDKPSPPGKVVLKGKAHSTWFKVAWDSPIDNGGSEVTKYVLECAQEKGQQMEQIYAGIDTEFLVGNVQPGATCRLRVFCVTNGGTSMPSEVALISTPPVVPGQCAPPRSASKSGPNIVPLRWDPPNYDGGSSIIHYEVAIDVGDFNQSTNLEESLKQVYHGPALDYPVGGLKPGTVYRFAVRAANRVGLGQWSDLVELSTSPGAPERPEIPEPETVTSDSVLLKWKKPHDNGSEISSYAIEWGSQESSMSIQRTSSVLSYNFSHLTPNLMYFFRIQAKNDAGKGPFSDVATVKTLPSCPSRIEKVWQGDILPIEKYMEELGMEDDEVDEATFPRPATSAMVCWDRPVDNGSEITHFILEVSHVKAGKKNSSGTDTMLLEIEGDDCCYLVRNLQPDSEYRVRIKAVNDFGSGSYSSPFTIDTQPLAPDPPVIECTCSYNSLKLKWSDSDTNLTYLLQMKERHGRYVTLCNGSSRTFKVNRCTERTTYFFRINAKNDAGEGPAGVYSFTTTTAPPPQPKNLPSVTVYDDSVNISWDEVESMKGDTVTYLLNIESLDSPTLKKTVSLDQNSFKLDDLIPGCRYKIQVALVRHVLPVGVPKMQDAATQLEEGDDANQPVIQENQDEEIEEIIGQFSNWVTFEIPVSGSEDGGAISGLLANSSPTKPHRNISEVLKNTWARMCDDNIGPVLLMITFFSLAVIVAFFVQFVVD